MGIFIWDFTKGAEHSSEMSIWVDRWSLSLLGEVFFPTALQAANRGFRCQKSPQTLRTGILFSAPLLSNASFCFSLVLASSCGSFLDNPKPAGVRAASIVLGSTGPGSGVGLGRGTTGSQTKPTVLHAGHAYELLKQARN